MKRILLIIRSRYSYPIFHYDISYLLPGLECPFEKEKCKGNVCIAFKPSQFDRILTQSVLDVLKRSKSSRNKRRKSSTCLKNINEANLPDIRYSPSYPLYWPISNVLQNVEDKKLRNNIRKAELKIQQASELAARAEVLLPAESG